MKHLLPILKLLEAIALSLVILTGWLAVSCIIQNPLSMKKGATCYESRIVGIVKLLWESPHAD